MQKTGVVKLSEVTLQLSITDIFRVYILASPKHEKGTRDAVEDLHNFREFAHQLLECLDEATIRKHGKSVLLLL